MPKIQRVQECLSIDIDADGNIVTPAVTVVERDGVEIVTTGSAGKEKRSHFKTTLCGIKSPALGTTVMKP